MNPLSISPERLAVADELLARGVVDGLFPHASYALARGGQVAARQSFGAASLETVFDLASLTKPVATATAVLQLAERGKLHLRQSAGRFFEEEFGPLPHLADVELHHLLTHTSGLPPIPRWPAASTTPTRTEMVRHILTTPLLRAPGVGFTYSDNGYLILGEIIGRVSKQGQDAYFREEIATPLGLTQTGYLPGALALSRLAPTGKDIPKGAVHDPRSREMGGVSGHAGLFGTADDLLAYAEAIRQGGGAILSRAGTARMAVSQIAPSVGGQSFGWFCAGNDYLPSGDFFSDRAFGHSGFTGTVLLIDPAYDVSLVLLTNRTANEESDGVPFLRLRRLWLNAVAASLT